MTDPTSVEVPGGRLAYEAEGKGPALTLIHAGVAHMRMWDEQVPAFAEHYRVIRYDTRGFGMTRSTDVEFSNRDDLRALLDHLSVERTHLLGISRGGSIALDFALEFPERLNSLVLVASTPGGFEHEDAELDSLWTEMETLYEAKDWEKLVELETALWTDGPGQPTNRVDGGMRRRMVEWNLWNYRAQPGEGKPQPLDPPAVGRLAEVAVPTLVMWGDLDEGGVLAGGEALASGIAGARSHVFEGVAHMVNMERSEEFTTRVLDFLAEEDTPGSDGRT
ncbi:MAG: alpha/beta fold hydrolase [Chloroflexota bacterium]|nr:alpha/beta fold hydrolase [Chloroflexota bacterium]